MPSTLRLLRAPLAALVIALLAGAAAAPAERFHTRLVKSNPSKDTVLTASPEKLELWFSEKIDLAQSRVQLVGAGDKVVHLTPITRDDSKPDQPVVATLLADLAPGTYTVNWSASSGDGHPVRGGFRFSVRAP
jgi:methionine-rich copper-binding protein CopC